MGLFAPWFLAGLAGVALPLYLHLLKKLKTTPKPVPSLMFFESRTVSSTHHRRLRYYLLLSLRLAFLGPVVAIALSSAILFYGMKFAPEVRTGAIPSDSGS